MKFRYARHSDDLDSLVDFYTSVIGLEILGSFEDHSEYNGVFLGFENRDWHLEFTQSHERVSHYPDEDDLIVFYVYSEEELQAIVKDAKRHGMGLVEAKNPYWQENGILIRDPDGFGVIISVQQKKLESKDAMTSLLIEQEIMTWDDFLNHVRTIPYGRNSNRSSFDLVLKENKGTCSSKHALIKQVADRNGIEGVQLIMGMYKMNVVNTKGIGDHLEENGLEYLPEAHCYLKINGKRIDLTSPKADIINIQDDIIEEQIIDVEQVGQFKIDYHKDFLKKWIRESKLNQSFDEIWSIRERCIAELSGH